MYRLYILLLLWLMNLDAVSQPDWHLTNYDKLSGTPHAITRIVQDRYGLLWMSSHNGLYRYDGYEWRNYKSRSGDGTRLKSSYIKKIYLSREGNIWCLVDHHAILFNLKTYQFVDVLAKYEKQTGKSLAITAIRTLNNGSTWFITSDGTLLTTPTDACTEIKKVMMGVGDKKTNISDDENGLIWIVTPQSVFTYDGKVLKKTKKKPKTTSDNQTAPSSTVIAPGDYHFTDIKGNIWFLHNEQLMRQTFNRKSYQPFPLPQPADIRCAMIDRQGRLWLSDKDNGWVMLFTTDGKQMGYMRADGRLQSNPCLFEGTVYSMLQDRQGYLWLGTRDNGIFRLKENGNKWKVEHYTNENSTLNDHKIYDLAEDGQGRIWVATDKGGPNCIPNPQADHPSFIHAANGLKGWKNTFCKKCYCLLSTYNQHLLVGTEEGLYIADIRDHQLQNLVFKEHQREAHRKESLGSSNVGSMIETNTHRLFVGTQGGGINEILSGNLKDNQLVFRHYDATNGLPSDMPSTMFCARNGNLWIVDRDQLTEMVLQPDGKQEDMRYNTYLGNEQLDFTHMKPVEIADGKWLLGGSQGVVAITLDQLKNNHFIPPIVVTGVEIEGETLNYAPQQNDTIILAPGQCDVTITFAALDYVLPSPSNPTPLKYAFRMDDKQAWNYIGSGGHSIVLANLESGTYRLTICSTNSDGIWTDNNHIVTIIVKPTFWQTGWAKLLIAIIILMIGGIVTYTLLYIRQVKRQQRETLEAYLNLLDESKEMQENNKQPDKENGGERRKTAEKLSPDDDTFMKRLMAYIEINISNSCVTPEGMAEATATSRSSLNRKMSRLVGMSPMEFLREARIRKATQLLKETQMPINNIAYACGFSDPKYFSKCFKLATGMTPSQFKEELP